MLLTVFYPYQYLLRQPNWQSTLRYVLIFAGALAIIINVIYTLRHRDVTKYRDLLVIIVIAVLLTIGIQVVDLQQNQSASRNSLAAANLLTSIAKTKKISPKRLAANSTSVYTGMLIQFDHDNDKTYTVIIDTDGASYQLKHTN
ncbi:DUF3290 family protein [Lacticaseibacillus saniviri]|nr:DUF3290 family protein [Lacticaseibacillus saniviri]